MTETPYCPPGKSLEETRAAESALAKKRLLKQVAIAIGVFILLGAVILAIVAAETC